MKRVLELRQKRAALITEARQIHEAAPAEGMGAEEQQRWDRLMAEADKLAATIEREERMAAAVAEIEDERGNGREDYQPDGETPEQRQMTAFRKLLPAWVTQDFRQFKPQELRALQAEIDTTGGYLRPPMQFINDLLKAVDDQVYIRQWASKFTVTSAESMGVPTLEADPADSDWTSELATGSEDSTMAFGRRELHPHPLAKRIKISRKLIRAVPNADGLVQSRLAYKFAITEEKAFLTGAGAQQPLGLFVASNLGISTGRDMATGNTTTAITSDGLKEAKYKLKGQYHPRARWLFHRDGVKNIAKLKDGEGQYIWRPGITENEPDMLLGRPIFMSEYVPNTWTAALYVGMFGDFSHYWIADALTLEFQVLQELYAETNQVGLIGRLECDGMPVMEEAFSRVQLAAG